MVQKLTKIFTFCSAHHLPGHIKCGNNHGHEWKLEVTLEGEVKNHMVIDFHEFNKIVNDKVLSKLDHRDLNDIFEYPSCEEIAKWVWDELLSSLGLSIRLYRIILWENQTSYTTYEGKN